MWVLRSVGVSVAAACALLAIGCGGETGSGRGRGAGNEGGTGGTDTSTAGEGDFGNPDPIQPAPTNPINPGGTGCAPGHYVGSFEGTYQSAAWGNGAAPLTVTAVESEGKPGLEFWLEASEAPCPADSEFCGDFTVKGGKIRGFANPFSDPNAPPGTTNPLAIAVRFEIDFGGELDCSTGQFMGLLQNGCYDVATVLYRFEGTAPATYDKPTSTFTMGEWTVKETPMAGVLFPPDSNIGGVGTWTASLADDGTSPVAAGMGLCDTP